MAGNQLAALDKQLAALDKQLEELGQQRRAHQRSLEQVMKRLRFARPPEQLLLNVQKEALLTDLQVVEARLRTIAAVYEAAQPQRSQVQSPAREDAAGARNPPATVPTWVVGVIAILALLTVLNDSASSAADGNWINLAALVVALGSLVPTVSQTYIVVQTYRKPTGSNGSMAANRTTGTEVRDTPSSSPSANQSAVQP